MIAAIISRAPVWRSPSFRRHGRSRRASLLPVSTASGAVRPTTKNEENYGTPAARPGRGTFALDTTASRAVSLQGGWRRARGETSATRQAALRGRSTQATPAPSVPARICQTNGYTPRRLRCACALRCGPGRQPQPVSSTQAFNYPTSTYPVAPPARRVRATDLTNNTDGARSRGGHVGSPGGSQ